MSKVLVNDTDLSGIANAIRQKVGGSTLYKPSEMAQVVLDIPTGITPTGTINITQNGTVNVTQYASVAVAVPNSYVAGDEGKVVSNGALVAQTARSSEITQNGTYDTTENNSVVVNVSGGGGSADDPFALTDYIESSGTQYIDTGYIVQDNSRFEAVAIVSNNNVAWGVLFGTRIAYNNNVCIFGAYGNNRPGWVTCWGGTQTETVTNGIIQITNNKAVYGLKKDNFGAYNSKYILGGEPSGMNHINNNNPVYLFTMNTAGTSDAPVIAKVYRFRIYEGDVLIHEFVPWTDSNDVVCLKDTITGNLKYNQGTGVFVRGTDS